MNKKKILIHAPNLSTPGGKQTYYTALSKHFKGPVSFFFYGAQGRKESPWSLLKRLFSDYTQFYRRLKKEKYDIALLNPSLNPKSFFRDSLFALICTLAGTKFIVFWRGWNWDFENKVVRRILPFFKLTYGKADAMILLAKEFSQQIRAYGYQRPLYQETTVVDDTILGYKNGSSRSAGLRRVEGTVSLLFLARIEKVKGIYETVDSFKRLQARYPHIALNIAGTGGELEQLKQYVAEKGIPQVNFLGWISGKEKAQALHKSDIYLLPSYHGEGMPNSLLEAMASGLAIVTTDVGGIKDFFEPGKMGFYVEPRSTDDLERQVNQLLSNPQLLAQVGAYNAAYAREHFTPALVAERLERICVATA